MTRTKTRTGLIASGLHAAAAHIEAVANAAGDRDWMAGWSEMTDNGKTTTAGYVLARSERWGGLLNDRIATAHSVDPRAVASLLALFGPNTARLVADLLTAEGERLENETWFSGSRETHHGCDLPLPDEFMPLAGHCPCFDAAIELAHAITKANR